MAPPPATESEDAPGLVEEVVDNTGLSPPEEVDKILEEEAPLEPPSLSLPGHADDSNETEASAAVAPASNVDYGTAEAPPAAGTALTSGKPRKRIERCARAWDAEDASQMSVKENEFVSVWQDTKTDHGWIHAEGRKDSEGNAGWLPVCVLKQLPEKQYWMATTQKWQAMDESQCNIEDGAVVIVWVNTRTPEGWTYVEVEDEAGVCRPGWLPVFCLEWHEEE
jgi:hypothetical protein